MGKQGLIAIGMLLSFGPLVFGEDHFDSITTTGGQTYNDVTVKRSNPEGIDIVYDSEATHIPFAKLSPEIQAKYGYDPAKEQSFVGEERKKKQEYEKQLADQAAESAMWEPYSSALKSGNLAPDKRRRLELELEILQKTCKPLLDNGVISREQVTKWCKEISEKSIQVGMPSSLVLVAFGEPDSINDDSSGNAQWCYDRNISNAMFVYIKGGFVSSWQRSH
jgi:hypothetical protein